MVSTVMKNATMNIGIHLCGQMVLLPLGGIFHLGVE